MINRVQLAERIVDVQDGRNGTLTLEETDADIDGGVDLSQE